MKGLKSYEKRVVKTIGLYSWMILIGSLSFACKKDQQTVSSDSQIASSSGDKSVHNCKDSEYMDWGDNMKCKPKPKCGSGEYYSESLSQTHCMKVCPEGEQSSLDGKRCEKVKINTHDDYCDTPRGSNDPDCSR